MRSILVVEDEMEIARTLRDFLEVAGFDVQVVGNGTAALAAVRGHKPDAELDVPAPDNGSADAGAGRRVRVRFKHSTLTDDGTP